MKYSSTLGRALLLCCSKKRPGGERESNIYCTVFECLYELDTPDGVLPSSVENAALPCRYRGRRNDSYKQFLGNSSYQNFGTIPKFLDHMLSGQENKNVVSRALMPIIGTLTVLSDQLDLASKKY